MYNPQKIYVVFFGTNSKLCLQGPRIGGRVSQGLAVLQHFNIIVASLGRNQI